MIEPNEPLASMKDPANKLKFTVVAALVGVSTLALSTIGLNKMFGAPEYQVVNNSPQAPLVAAETLTPSETMGTLHVLKSPYRAYDSRNDSKGLLNPGKTWVVDVRNDQSDGDFLIPENAKGVILNFTAVGASGSGYVSVASGDITEKPAAATLAYQASVLAVSNGTSVTLPDPTGARAGEISMTAGGGAGTHVIVDVVGYYS